MDPLDSLVVGENGCTFKDIVDVFCNELNSVTFLNSWTDFARELNISPLQIEEWRNDKLLNKLTLTDILHGIIATWKKEQGNDATLSELLKHLEKRKLKNVEEDLMSFFSRESPVQECEAIFKLTLPTKSNYYIQRTLITRSSIEEKVFSSTHRDIFVLQGIERHRLSQLANKELTDTSSNQVGKPEVSVRFILLERFGHWALLCGKTTNPIHLLRHHTGRFHWICTQGDISALQNATDEKTQKELSEEEFIQEIEADIQFQANQPICLSDSPGMGKSLLLASIGMQLQQRCPQRSIAFIVISEFVVKVRRLLPQFHNTKEAALEALLQILCENNSARRHLVQKITTPTEEKSTQFELMFDGFDEVLTENFELAHECLEIFKTNFNNTVRVWVTTRPQHLRVLEKRFSVLGYNIQGFQEKHQIDFLTSYWNHQGTTLDGHNLQFFSKHCLSTLKKKLNKKDEDIAGIPLQCMMIAEVYMQDAHLFCDSRNERLENSPAAFPRIEVNSITDLYEKMIYHKIEKFIGTYPVMKEQINSILPWHVYLALELIFPSHFHKFKDTLNLGSRLTEGDFANIGILEIRGTATKDPASFIHRTFAEYLAAHYFFSYEISHSTAELQNCSTRLPNFLFKDVLECSVKECQSPYLNSTCYECSFKHPVLCHFLDALLGSGTHISNENSISLESSKCIKDVVFACIHSDFGNILKFIGSLEYPQSFCVNKLLYFDSEILIDATTMASLDLLIFLIQTFEHKPLNTIEGRIHYRRTALHAAVCRGSYTIFEYILKQHHFEELVREIERFKDLMYWTVENTVGIDLDKINDRVQILTALHGLNREMINYCERTPLFARGVNFLLLKKLIECGAVLSSRSRPPVKCDKHGFSFNGHCDENCYTCKKTILHKATEYLPSTEYYDLLQSIPIQTLKSLLQMRNEFEETSLHLIVKHGLVTHDILNLILSTGFNINIGGLKGRTCLFYTLEMKNKEMTLPTIKLLLNNGANYEVLSSFGDSIVHYSANMGRIDCLEFFLEKKNMNVNQKDKQGRTPIFRAIYSSSLEVVEFLIERGADHKILDSNGGNLLHYLAQLGNIECLQLFLSLGGLDINLVSKSGDTPLLRAFERYSQDSRVEIIRLLLEKGADHTILDKGGENVLHRSARIGSAEFFNLFAGLPSLDVNARNSNKETPLHLVFKNINQYVECDDDFKSFLHIIEELLSRGADVNAKNNSAETPFDIYQKEKVKCIYLKELMEKDWTICKLLQGTGK